MNKIPTIKCLPRDDFFGGMMFWCPFCEKMHLHGQGKGHRCAHCHSYHKTESPFEKSGYTLKMFNKTELKKIKKAIEEYLEMEKERS